MASWTRDGIAGLQSVVLYSLPELDGAIDTVPLGGLVGDNIFLVSERVTRLSQRIKKWVHLRRSQPQVLRAAAKMERVLVKKKGLCLWAGVMRACMIGYCTAVVIERPAEASQSSWPQAIKQCAFSPNSDEKVDIQGGSSECTEQ